MIFKRALAACRSGAPLDGLLSLSLTAPAGYTGWGMEFPGHQKHSGGVITFRCISTIRRKGEEIPDGR